MRDFLNEMFHDHLDNLYYDACDERYIKKFEYVFSKNSGLKTIEAIANVYNISDIQTCLEFSSIE